MGWTFFHRDKGESHLDVFRHEFGEDVLDVAQNGHVVYIALRTKLGSVIALICPIEWRNHDYYNFGYKDQEEGMGCYESNCPQRILDQLSPAYDSYSGQSLEWALAWRQRCAERNGHKRQIKAGVTIRFSTPITFTNGDTLDTFIVKSLKPLVLTSVDGYGRYRVTRDTLANAEVITPWPAK